MSTAPAANSMHRANTHAATRVPANASGRTDSTRTLQMGADEAAVLNIDLTGLQLPKVGGLQVDGFKPSFFERLFGKR